MSTKTTYKRIALVAVAALGFGLLSVAPSSASVPQSDTLAISATGNATSVDNNTAASTTLTQTFLGVAQDTMTVTVALVSGPTGNDKVPTLTAQGNGSATNGTVAVSGLVGTSLETTTSGSTYVLFSGKYTVGFPATTLAGTYVIKITPGNVPSTVATVASPVTWTVTVGASTTDVAADTTSNFVLDSSPASLGSGSTNAVIVVPVSSGSAVAAIRVVPRVASALTTGSLTMSTVITGVGTITAGSAGAALGSTSGARALTSTGNGGFVVYVYGDGTAGTATITITIGTVVSTKTVTFYGAAASVTSTLVQPVVAVGSSGFGVGAITANAKDAAGNAVPGAKLWLLSSDPTVIASGTAAITTAGSAGAGSFDLVGLKAGTTNITIQNVAAGSTATFSATALAVRVGSNTGASVTMTLDKATYEQGAAAVVTVMIKDAAGNAVANGDYTPFSAAAVSTKTVSGTLPPTTYTSAGSAAGTFTYAINVPTTSGAFTISATAGSGWTGTFSATATVNVSAAEAASAEAIAAAADAAAEATDAANAATDAANAAAEAADAATAAAQDAADSIAALSVQVGELVAGLTAQITAQKAAIRALTNLVIKIQKKIFAKK